MTDENLKPTQTVILPEFSMEKMLESCIIPEYSVMPIGPMLEVGGFYPKDYPEGCTRQIPLVCDDAEDT